MEEGRRFVRDIIANEQWDAFQERFPDLQALSAFTTRNQESILHLVARFASPSFASEVIRRYRLGDPNSLLAKELWARRDKNGELCVNFKRFKHYFSKAFFDKVVAVYSGRYFAYPEEKWPVQKQTNPRVQVYKQFRRFALSAAFDHENEPFNNANFQPTEDPSKIVIGLRMPAGSKQVRSIPVTLKIDSQIPFLNQIYHQLDCPEDMMSPMLAGVLAVEQAVRREMPTKPSMAAAFRFFQDKGGVLFFENEELRTIPFAEMYTIPAEPCPPVVVCCPTRQTLPDSFNEILNSERQAHWIYDNFQAPFSFKETTEDLHHELLHVVVLSQDVPIHQTRLFTYTALCLMAHLRPQDNKVQTVLHHILSYYTTPAVFEEMATFLVSEVGPSSNPWARHIRQLMDLQVQGAQAPAVANRIDLALSDWDAHDIERMDELERQFCDLHKKSCPLHGRTSEQVFNAQWKRYQTRMDKLLSRFFDQNKDLSGKLLKSLHHTSKDLEVLAENPTTLGGVVLSEGWVRLLQQYSPNVLPELAVFKQSVFIDRSYQSPEQMKQGLNLCLDSCSPEIRSAQDVQALLAASLCAKSIALVLGQKESIDSVSVNCASYPDLTDGTVWRGLKKYAASLIRAGSQERLPRLITSRKKKTAVAEKDHQNTD